MGGKAASLRPGDSLVFGDSDRSVRVVSIDNYRKIVKVVVSAPEHVRVVNCDQQKNRSPDGEVVIVPKS